MLPILQLSQCVQPLRPINWLQRDGGWAGPGFVLLCAPVIFFTGILGLSNYMWSISSFGLMVFGQHAGLLFAGSFYATLILATKFLFIFAQASRSVASVWSSCLFLAFELTFPPNSAAVFTTKTKRPKNHHTVPFFFHLSIRKHGINIMSQSALQLQQLGGTGVCVVSTWWGWCGLPHVKCIKHTTLLLTSPGPMFFVYVRL